MAKSAVVIGGVVALAVIGGGILLMNNSDESSETNNQTPATSQTSTSDQKMSEKMNIVETAVATSSLSTLVAAVQAADLATTLSDESASFTVFAPTNAAFEALPDGTLTDLLKPENKAKLAGILTYHVVPGKVMAKDLKDGQKVKTVQGEELTVSIKSGVVKINGATVAQADVDTSNGVVHVIDTVLLPAN